MCVTCEAGKLKKRCEQTECAIEFVDAADHPETTWTSLQPMLRNLLGKGIPLPKKMQLKVLGYKVLASLADLCADLSESKVASLLQCIIPFVPQAQEPDADDQVPKGHWQAIYAARSGSTSFDAMLPRLRDISGTDTPAEKVDLFIQLLVHDLIKDLVGKGEAGASPLKTCCAALLRVFEDEVALMEEVPGQFETVLNICASVVALVDFSDSPNLEKIVEMEQATRRGDNALASVGIILDSNPYFKSLFDDLVANVVKFKRNYPTLRTLTVQCGALHIETTESLATVANMLQKIPALRMSVREGATMSLEQHLQTKLVETCTAWQQLQEGPDTEALKSMDEAMKHAKVVWPDYVEVERAASWTTQTLQAARISSQFQSLATALQQSVEATTDGLDIARFSEAASFVGDCKGKVAPPAIAQQLLDGMQVALRAIAKDLGALGAHLPALITMCTLLGTSDDALELADKLEMCRGIMQVLIAKTTYLASGATPDERSKGDQEFFQISQVIRCIFEVEDMHTQKRLDPRTLGDPWSTVMVEAYALKTEVSDLVCGQKLGLLKNVLRECEAGARGGGGGACWWAALPPDADLPTVLTQAATTLMTQSHEAYNQKAGQTELASKQYSDACALFDRPADAEALASANALRGDLLLSKCEGLLVALFGRCGDDYDKKTLKGKCHHVIGLLKKSERKLGDLHPQLRDRAQRALKLQD